MQRNAISVTYLVMKRFSPFFYSLVLIVLFFNGIVSPESLACKPRFTRCVQQEYQQSTHDVNRKASAYFYSDYPLRNSGSSSHCHKPSFLISHSTQSP